MFEFSTKATMLLLSILITLAVVEGGDEQPFTAFSHAAMQFSRGNTLDPEPIIKRQTFEVRKTQPVAETFNQLLNQQFQKQIPAEFRRTQPVQQPNPVEFRRTQPVQQPNPDEFRRTQPVAEELNQLLNQQFQNQIPVEFRRNQPVQQPNPVEFRRTQPVAKKLNQLLNQQFQNQIPVEFRRTQ